MGPPSSAPPSVPSGAAPRSSASSTSSAAAAGADGVLATDLTPEEADDYRRILAAHHLDTIFLGALTSTDERLAKIAACSSGFLYVISRTGVTGAKDALPDDLPALLRRTRRVTQLPIAVGFGISLPGHVSVLGDRKSTRLNS